MRSSSNETLERIARRVPIPEPAYERMLSRRDRKRRNQRIAAGTVGIAVFVAAVLVVTSFGSLDRTQTPVVPGGPTTGLTATGQLTGSTGDMAETGPTGPTMVTGSPGWDGQGLPPEGAVPSTPEEGEVVAQYAELHAGFLFAYADGRVIWSQGQMGVPHLALGTGGLSERRLTPEGVELVRSGALKPEDLLGPVYEVPASAWADREARPYVPSRYAVCYYRAGSQGYEDPPTVLRFLPAQARAILSGKDHSYEHSGGVLDPGPMVCSEVTTDEARELSAILGGLKLEDAEGDEIAVEINMLLPHGEWVQLGG